MNLREIANACIQGINPDQTVTWRRSGGYTVLPSGKTVPSYEDTECLANVQSLSDQQLRHMNGLNISGVMRSLYLSSNAMGISFRQIRGGDLFIFREFEGVEPTTWKVVNAAETWDNWAHVIVVQQ